MRHRMDSNPNPFQRINNQHISNKGEEEMNRRLRSLKSSPGSKTPELKMIHMQAPCKTESQPYAYLNTGDGVRLRYGFWSCQADACRGTLLLLNGRSEYMEKYHAVIQELNARGFHVVSFDWRGQGLSERLLAHPTKGYVDSFDHYMIDLEAVLNEALPRCRGPLMLVAHSMGGHIALRCLYKHPGLFDRTILCAPMIDINTAPMPKYLARLFSRWLRSAGFARAMIAGAGCFDPYGRSFEHNQLTSDRQRFEQIRQTIAGNPSLVAAHVTNGWLAAAFDSIDILHRPGFNSSIHTPLLILMAGRDRIVVNQAIRRFSADLPNCRLVVIEGARHEILQERDALRSQFWEAFDAFIADPPAPWPPLKNGNPNPQQSKT